MEAVIVALMSCTLAQAPAGGCGKDTDCKGERICVDGQCRDPEAVAPVAPAASHPEAQSAPASAVPPPVQPGAGQSLFGFQADLGGFLTYGPALSFEIGGRVAFVGTVRAVGLGLVRHLTAGNNAVSFSDWGAGGGFRVYLGSQARRQGFYVGPTAEYVSTSETEGDSLPPGVQIQYQTKLIVVGIDTGYRWVFASGLTVSVGAILGYSHPIDKSMQVTGGSADGFSNGASDGVAPLVTCEIGYAF